MLDPTGPAGLRTLVVADVLRRVLEHFHALRVHTTVVRPDDLADLDRRLDELWIRPPSPVTQSPEGPVHLVAETPESGSVADTEPDGALVLSVAPAEMVTDQGNLLDDPLVLRMALLRAPYRTPVTLGAAELGEAAAALERWRRRVAAWAHSVSVPIPPEPAESVRARFNDDIDVPGALAALEHLADDPRIPDGAKFETLAYFDRIFALDLARYLGSPGW